ncbi:XRE family transcriptional regulator [Muribacter muris]|uniref:XRE family transcriptional regulator n=2 Tax=Muribacter muris TaxID=67855 RepID=A0A4Y9JS35_9PAST|nr:helix-turn-helix transcriptional regulator [Glaesserella parasuis]MBF0786262.1 helix-turn-helix transcriptional regulator [Muribacter muris]ATW42416.1 hypothetical protein A2U20_00615 [Glaesserella parasuis D74]ATW42452.1 hypothetical protein A2U20_00825 [Glaesserella parasuis D74]EQA07949.1 helix-turn-helix family protein [Glaesserella parasuis D74]MBF0827872.1 helix-turn-helix transcriptional regulator [Muribacter muris]
MRIFERLKLVCEERKWKLKDFSEITGLPYRTAQGYLNGSREPNSEGLSIICEKTNINLNWLVCGKGAVFGEGSMDLSMTEIKLLNDFRKCNEIGKKAILVNCNAVSEIIEFKG